VALVNSTTDTLKKSRLRDKTKYRTRFSCLINIGWEMEQFYSFDPGTSTGP